MWVSPNHPDPPRQADPPEDPGRRLCTLARGTAELRVSLATYGSASRPYISLRVWEPGYDGSPYPTKSGCSVRIHEIDEVISALEHAKSILLEGERPRDDRRGEAPAGKGVDRTVERSTVRPSSDTPRDDERP